jgi:alcohol dehydrogenase (cytochrome c)
VWELILAELPVNGITRKVVMQLNRNGFLYVLDRATGELLAANAYEKVNWASHIDMKTGRPVETDVAKKLRAGGQIEMWPSTLGGKNWPHAAFNPQTGLLYANTIHEGRLFRHLTVEEWKAGQRFVFVENFKMPPNGEPVGHVDAIDPLTGKQRWRVPLNDLQNWSAMLATGSGLLFTGRENGEFVALDADDGKILWQFQTGSGINAMPVTYTHRGRQYVTVLSGVGGLYWNMAKELLKDVAPGGSVWTFALLPN